MMNYYKKTGKFWSAEARNELPLWICSVNRTSFFPKTKSGSSFLASALQILLFVLTASAQKVAISSDWSPYANVFADAKEITVQTTHKEGDPISFTVSFEHRTLVVGTTRADANGIVRLPVELPGMKPGVALPVELTLSRLDKTHFERKKAWAFSRDPAINPAKKIMLFDTGDKTADALESLSIPFTRGNTDLLATPDTNTLVIVGENFSEHGTLDAIMQAAVLGVDVLILAPEKNFTLPLPSEPKNFHLGSAQDILRNPKAVYKLILPKGGLRLAAQDDEVVLRTDEKTTAQAAQWTFTNGGRVRVCGAPLILNWETTPAARWLLAEMLNSTTGEQP